MHVAHTALRSAVGVTTCIQLLRDGGEQHEADHRAIRLYEVVPHVEMAGTRIVFDRLIAFAVVRTLDRDTMLAADAVALVDDSDIAIGPGVPPSGRLVRFPGQSELGGALTPEEIASRSSITCVETVRGAIDPDDVVVIEGLVQPVLRDRESVLYVRPRGDGRFRPFELEVRYPCCAGISANVAGSRRVSS